MGHVGAPVRERPCGVMAQGGVLMSRRCAAVPRSGSGTPPCAMTLRRGPRCARAVFKSAFRVKIPAFFWASTLRHQVYLTSCPAGLVLASPNAFGAVAVGQKCPEGRLQGGQIRTAGHAPVFRLPTPAIIQSEIPLAPNRRDSLPRPRLLLMSLPRRQSRSRAPPLGPRRRRRGQAGWPRVPP
jgi:hypothetical protein